MKLDYRIGGFTDLPRPADPAAVTSLDARFNRLRTLPEWLRSCRELRVLQIGYNELVELPEWLGEFSQLRILGLTHNPLGAFPAALSRLPSLESLRLAAAGLRCVPDDFQPPALTFLDLSRNHLHTLPTGLLEHCRNLRVLLLRENRLRHLDPIIANLTALRRLDLSFNKLALLRCHTYRFASLRVLHLQVNRLRALPCELADLPALKELLVHDNRLTQISDAFAHLPKLERLDLSNNALTGLPLEIGDSPALRLLIASGNHYQWLPVSLTRLPAFTLTYEPLKFAGAHR